MLTIKPIPKNMLVLFSKPISWVVLSLFLVSLPHSQHFPIWISILLLSLLISRLYIEIKNYKTPKKYLLVILSIFSFMGIYMSFNTNIGKTAGSALLILLVTIKLFESHKTRDYRLIINLCFFIMATNFLFSQSLFTLAFMLLTVVILLISLMRITQQNSLLDFQQDLKMALRLSALALPLMLVLFILFPRIPGPLWQLPKDQNSAQTGLSDYMSPANISRLIQSNALAFSVKFVEQVPPQKNLYWRAIVLWDFDGKTWKTGTKNPTKHALIDAISSPINYSITLEPHGKNWIFALDVPYTTTSTTHYNNNYLLRSEDSIHTLKEFHLNAVLKYRMGKNISYWEQQAGLAIPPNSNPKTLALAKQWQQKFQQPELIIQQALQRFNRQNFIYTLQPPLATHENIVDDFLFNSRKGFCQHYASSFALLMRAAGIPTRIVLGYQGGHLNPLNQVLSVRQSDAHAWTEVWIKNKGWIRIDPTAAVAPERIEQSINAALENSHSRPFFMRLNNGLLLKLNQYWDVFDNDWKQWVVGYNSQRQKDLLADYFGKKISANELIQYLIISVASMMILISLYIFKPFKRQIDDPVERLYKVFCDKFSVYDLTREIYTGPKDFAKAAIKIHPQQRKKILSITQLYISIKYQSKNKATLLPLLKDQIKAFKLP